MVKIIKATDEHLLQLYIKVKHEVILSRMGVEWSFPEQVACFPVSRGGGHSLQRVSVQLPSSSDDEIYTRVLPPQSPADAELQGQSDSLRSEEEEEEEEVGSPPGSSFVGLRVVAKWSSNGYFYSGRIMKDAGEGRFRLRFDDGYECEVAGKDILLCDPIPLETEVTALLEDEYFSIGEEDERPVSRRCLIHLFTDSRGGCKNPNIFQNAF